jgi:hypothetical protein
LIVYKRTYNRASAPMRVPRAVRAPTTPPPPSALLSLCSRRARRLTARERLVTPSSLLARARSFHVRARAPRTSARRGGRGRALLPNTGPAFAATRLAAASRAEARRGAAATRSARVPLRRLHRRAARSTPARPGGGGEPIGRRARESRLIPSRDELPRGERPRPAAPQAPEKKETRRGATVTRKREAAVHLLGHSHADEGREVTAAECRRKRACAWYRARERRM